MSNIFKDIDPISDLKTRNELVLKCIKTLLAIGEIDKAKLKMNAHFKPESSEYDEAAECVIRAYLDKKLIDKAIDFVQTTKTKRFTSLFNEYLEKYIGSGMLEEAQKMQERLFY